MRLVTVNGSMHGDNHTGTIIQELVQHLETLDAELQNQAFDISQLQIEPCRMSCSDYCSESAFRCILEDPVNDILEAMEQADAVVLGAPLYFRVPPARFHALVERIISIYYFKESRGAGYAHSPLYNKPCVLVGVAEYTNPQQVLEYLQEACHVLKMRPVMLPRFPYLGIGGQGTIENDRIFDPLERAREMASALWSAYHGHGHDGVRPWLPIPF